MSKVSCDVPVAVYGVIAIFEIAFAVLVAGIVFAVFCVVAALTGDVEQSRGRLVKCLGLSYWIFIPVGAATLVVFSLYNPVEMRGWSCIPYSDGMEWFGEITEAMNSQRLLP